MAAKFGRPLVRVESSLDSPYCSLCMRGFVAGYAELVTCRVAHDVDAHVCAAFEKGAVPLKRNFLSVRTHYMHGTTC
eukprot:SAG31_NODE_20141_length_582_cov_1.635611_1_plen_76_part_01